MKITEIILSSLIFLGVIFKFALFPGGGILLTVGFSFLSLLYFFVGFALFSGIGFRGMLKSSSYSELSALKVLGFVGAGWSLSMLCLGILFKIQHWPGSEVQLVSGLITALVSSVVALFKFMKGKQKVYRKMLVRFLILGSIGLIIVSVSILDIERLLYRNHPEYVKAFENYMENPDNQDLREKMEIEQLRTTMSDEDVELYLEYYNGDQDN